MKRTLLTTLLLIIALYALAQPTIQIVQFATGFSNPVDMAFAPGDDKMYVVQQRGRIRMVQPDGTVLGTDFLDISSLVSLSGSETGLLGLAFHPNYQQNGYFYVNYTRASNGATRISRFSRSTSNPLVADPNSEVVLLEIAQPFSNHNGGCIRFGPDGYLYIGMGDGGSAGDPGNRAQNPTNLLGKMLRINVDAPSGYSIPLTNPFYGQTDTLPEIWALGLRNPWKFHFDKLTGDLWIADVGQNAMEEINFQQAGDHTPYNYGWRCYEGTNTYNTSGCLGASNYTFPVATYNRVTPHCSVTGGLVYRGANYADLYGKYIFTDYCSGRFWTTYPNGSGGWITDQLNQISGYYFVSFVENHQGDVFIADISLDRIYRIQSSNGCNPVAVVHAENNTSAICSGDSLRLFTPAGNGFSYQWYFNGNPIAGATQSQYYANQPGNYHVVVTAPGNCTNTATPFTVTLSTTPAANITATTTNACIDGAPITISSSPAGGVYSGTPILGNEFLPGIAGVGVHPVIYSVTNSEGCIGRDTVWITVHDLPTAQINNLPAQYCIDSAAFALSGIIGGGTFSGPGVFSGIFDPTIAGIGTHAIVYQVTDINGCMNADTAYVEVVSACNTALLFNESIQSLAVYPNPTVGEIWIEFESNEENPVKISIQTLEGKAIYSMIWQTLVGKNKISLHINSLSSGMYILKLENQNVQLYRNLVVNK